MTDMAEGAGMDESTRDEMLRMLGANLDTPIRVFSVIPPEVLQTMYGSMKINGDPPTVIQVATMTTFFKDITALVAPSVDSQAPTALPPSASTPTTAVGQSANSQILIRHNLVISQTDDRTSPQLTDTEHIQYLQRYESLFGSSAEPDDDIVPGAEQLACLQTIISAGQVPYTDFAIFGPHATRMQRKMRLHGSRLLEDGKLGVIEITGPPDFTSWLSSWSVFQTAMVMMNGVDLGILDLYRKKIEKYSKLYGESVWINLYQADVRARLERWPKHRLSLVAQMRNQGPFGNLQFDPNRPWNAALLRVIQDQEWWNDQFCELAKLIRIRIMPTGSFVEGDAPIGSVPNVSSPLPLQEVRVGTKRKNGPEAPTLPPPPTHPTKNRKKAHTAPNANGLFTHTKSGKQICTAFQNGTCPSGGLGKQCNSGLHICNKCMHNAHGSQYDYKGAKAATCTRSLQQGGKSSTGGKGKGKTGY